VCVLDGCRDHTGVTACRDAGASAREADRARRGCRDVLRGDGVCGAARRGRVGVDAAGVEGGSAQVEGGDTRNRGGHVGLLIAIRSGRDQRDHVGLACHRRTAAISFEDRDSGTCVAARGYVRSRRLAEGELRDQGLSGSGQGDRLSRADAAERVVREGQRAGVGASRGGPEVDAVDAGAVGHKGRGTGGGGVVGEAGSSAGGRGREDGARDRQIEIAQIQHGDALGAIGAGRSLHSARIGQGRRGGLGC